MAKADEHRKFYATKVQDCKINAENKRREYERAQWELEGWMRAEEAFAAGVSMGKQEAKDELQS